GGMCVRWFLSCCFVFFFQAEDGIRDGHVTGVQTCALPIWASAAAASGSEESRAASRSAIIGSEASSWWCRRARGVWARAARRWPDRKSTRLNSSHVAISYAVFCLKKKNILLNVT